MEDKEIIELKDLDVLKDVLSGKTNIEDLDIEVEERLIKFCKKRIKQMKEKNAECDKKIAGLEEIINYINNN